VARLLIIGGGCRGLGLARQFVQSGHAVRITTRGDAGRAAIEAAGAECWIGTPDRIGSLRNALAGATLLCWLLGTASGDADELAALHGSRLAMMLSQTIDTTVRGIVYEGAGSVEGELLARGAGLVREAAERSSIPYAVLDADPSRRDDWLRAAAAAVDQLLRGEPLGRPVQAGSR
jgi:uncharacterized protein YbjT (DUF2867 family)